MDSQFENPPRHPCDSHFPKGISTLSWSFLLENWNKTNVCEMITHYTSCQQCRTVSNSVDSVNSVNSYSAVLPPSPMVFLILEFGDKLELIGHSFELSLGVACYEFRYFLCQNTELSSLVCFRQCLFMMTHKAPIAQHLAFLCNFSISRDFEKLHGDHLGGAQRAAR